LRKFRLPSPITSIKVRRLEKRLWGNAMEKNSRLTFAFVAGPIVIGVAYGVSSLLAGGESATETADAGMSIAYGLLLWVGAPVAFVAALPLLAGVLKIFTKS